VLWRNSVDLSSAELLAFAPRIPHRNPSKSSSTRQPDSLRLQSLFPPFPLLPTFQLHAELRKVESAVEHTRTALELGCDVKKHKSRLSISFGFRVPCDVNVYWKSCLEIFVLFSVCSGLNSRNSEHSVRINVKCCSREKLSSSQRKQIIR
jgi:hypothetical protein